MTKADEAIVAKGDPEIGDMGYSLGTGPAGRLAQAGRPPDKIVLLAPFDSIAGAGQELSPFLPLRLLITENWDNVAALRSYSGKVETFAGDRDRALTLAKNLAASVKGARYVEIASGHKELIKKLEVVFTLK